MEILDDVSKTRSHLNLWPTFVGFDLTAWQLNLSTAQNDQLGAAANSPQAWWRHFPKQTRCAVACGIERSLHPSARHSCCAVTHDKQAIVHCYLQLNQVNGAPLLCAALLCEQCKTRGIEVLRCTEGPGCQKAMGQADPKWDSKVTRSSVQFAFCGRQEIVWRNSVNFSVEQ